MRAWHTHSDLRIFQSMTTGSAVQSPVPTNPCSALGPIGSVPKHLPVAIRILQDSARYLLASPFSRVLPHSSVKRCSGVNSGSMASRSGHADAQRTISSARNGRNIAALTEPLELRCAVAWKETLRQALLTLALGKPSCSPVHEVPTLKDRRIRYTNRKCLRFACPMDLPEQERLALLHVGRAAIRYVCHRVGRQVAVV